MRKVRYQVFQERQNMMASATLDGGRIQRNMATAIKLVKLAMQQIIKDGMKMEEEKLSQINKRTLINILTRLIVQKIVDGDYIYKFIYKLF